jgi:hypothetical protein
VSLVAGFPGFGTHATDLAALDQYVEQAAVRIQRAFRRLSKQRSKCLGSTVARPQPLTVYLQPGPEDEGDLDSKVDSSVPVCQWPTRRPVKLQRSSPACSLPAGLSLFDLDTGGILAGWLASPLSPGHGPHLNLGHPDPLQTRTPGSAGCFTAPQPDGSNALTDDDASVCTAAARMAPDSGSHWNRDFAD